MFGILSRVLSKKHGFTLVELMVVVVIIGILAGIAVPVYSGVKEKAAISACNANVRMLNAAIQQAEIEGEDITSESFTIEDLNSYFGGSAPTACPVDGSQYSINNGKIDHSHESADGE